MNIRLQLQMVFKLFDLQKCSNALSHALPYVIGEVLRANIFVRLRLLVVGSILKVVSMYWLTTTLSRQRPQELTRVRRFDQLAWSVQLWFK